MIRTTDSRYARYVGRVGALAFALGVGVAIADNPGVAVADTGDSTGSSAAHSARHTATASAGKGQTRPKRAAATTVTSARVVPSSSAASSQAGNGSTIPRSAASFSDVLGFARREIEQAQTATQPARSIGNIFFARTPVLAYNAAQNVQAADGTITGTHERLAGERIRADLHRDRCPTRRRRDPPRRHLHLLPRPGLQNARRDGHIHRRRRRRARQPDALARAGDLLRAQRRLHCHTAGDRSGESGYPRPHHRAGHQRSAQRRAGRHSDRPFADHATGQGGAEGGLVAGRAGRPSRRWAGRIRPTWPSWTRR